MVEDASSGNCARHVSLAVNAVVRWMDGWTLLQSTRRQKQSTVIRAEVAEGRGLGCKCSESSEHRGETRAVDAVVRAQGRGDKDKDSGLSGRSRQSSSRVLCGVQG